MNHNSDDSPRINATRRLIHRGLMVEYFSLGWMVMESIVAILAGLNAGSLALLAFGGDSVIELLSSYAVLNHLSKLDRCVDTSDADTERTEKITLMLLISLIPVIALGAFYSIFSGIKPEASLLGITIAIGAVIIMPFLWYEKKKIGKTIRCIPLSIDAVESVTCFYMSVTLLAGLLLNYYLHIAWADYIATAIILAFVAKEALESWKEMLHHAGSMEIRKT